MSEEMRPRVRPRTRRSRLEDEADETLGGRYRAADSGPPREAARRNHRLEREAPLTDLPRAKPPVWAWGLLALGLAAGAPVLIQHLSRHGGVPVAAASRTRSATATARGPAAASPGHPAPTPGARPESAQSAPVVSVTTVGQDETTPRSGTHRWRRRHRGSSDSPARVAQPSPAPVRQASVESSRSHAESDRSDSDRTSRRHRRGEETATASTTRRQPETGMPAGLGPAALNARGHRLQQQGRYAEAEPYLREAVRKRPGYPYAEYNLGETLLRQGKTQEALDHLHRTAAAQPGRWEPQQRLGEAYERLGRKGDASAAYSQASRLRGGRRTSEHGARRSAPPVASRAPKPDPSKKSEPPARKQVHDEPANGEDFPLKLPPGPTHVDKDSVLRPGPAGDEDQ